MKKIIVITHGYPIIGHPAKYQFVKELVQTWRKQGLDVTVINPLTPKDWRANRGAGSENEFFPLYHRFAFLKAVPFLRRAQNAVQDFFFRRAAERCIRDYENVVLYSHFLCAGNVAVRIAKKHNVEAYCAFGESTLWFLDDRNEKKADESIRALDGIVSVSSQNTRIIRERNWNDNVLEAPNAVDLSVFGVHGRDECREELGFPKDKVIGIFVGHFIERKGPLRTQAASHGIDGLKMIYIGEGEQKPEDENILFCGGVDHSSLYKYLYAADFFVLPTEAEGCCNAIVEALSCGLPVISSDGEFNDCILDDKNSIRVGADDVEALRSAMQTLVSDKEKREAMAAHIRSERDKYSIESRAAKIAAFIGAAQ